MNAKDEDAYPVESGSESDSEDHGEHGAPRGAAEALPLEDADEDGNADPDASPPPASAEPAPVARSGVKALDVCPNCGAPMDGADTLVCLRCGFDLKTMQVVETKTGSVEPEAEPEPPLLRDGPDWLPLGLAAVSTLVLVVGALLGWRGLFPNLAADAVAVTGGERLAGAAQTLVRIGLWAGCAYGGFVISAWLLGHPVGDRLRTLWRALGIVAAARVVTVMNLGHRFLELSLEAVLSAGVFILLTMLWFRLPPKHAARAVLFTGGAFFLVYVAAQLVTWSFM